MKKNIVAASALLIFCLLTSTCAAYASDDLDKQLFEAVDRDQSKKIERLVARGATVDVSDEDGRTPLHFAAAFGSEEMVRVLIASGANVNATKKNGRTPLHAAAFHKNIRNIILLVASGADVNVADTCGFTPLVEAACWGRIETIKTLIAHGADVYSKGKCGSTALQLAERLQEGNKREEAVSILTEAEAARANGKEAYETFQRELLLSNWVSSYNTVMGISVPKE